MWQYRVVRTINDTHRLISTLQEQFGFSKKQAEGITEAIITQEFDQLASKQDLQDMELRLSTRLWVVVGTVNAASTALLGVIIALLTLYVA